MNSLNILSARVTPGPSRTNSFNNSLTLASGQESRRDSREDTDAKKLAEIESSESSLEDERGHDSANEKTPLLQSIELEERDSKAGGWHSFPSSVASAIIASLRWVVSTLMAPGVYLVACLYDEQGRFSLLHPIRRIWARGVTADHALGHSSATSSRQRTGRDDLPSRRAFRITKKSRLSTSTSSGLSSESESDRDRWQSEAEANIVASSNRHTRSKSMQDADEIAPARRSIRIKLHNEDSLRQRKHRKSQSLSSQSNGSGAISASDITAANLKSPTSPAAALSMTKYPRAPAPPRPLIPPRQPSFSIPDASNFRPGLKTLVLDLDETLIHSMAKGGRMSTGHMVEVKLNTYIGVAGQGTLGPQHPILYYVHKRPHCDDFLRRVCKWYNLVIFTASVQEYADPVIDWLELERKFFSGRYYRQHCTYRHGAFIKDLSSVEPDLSKVMILDNSPLSYMFHQDNAIPIEGWINDPTDNDLLHLVPLLEGLQHVTDVRALLALKTGEDGR